MSVNINENELLRQVLLGKISAPTLFVEGGLTGAYVTTWDGKPKLGIGVGGIKYNVRVGDSCYGWSEAEYLEPGVSLIGVDEENGGSAYRMGDTARALVKYSCIGNRALVVNGDGKGFEGTVTGKGGTGTTGKHVYIDFKKTELEKLNIGDKVRIDSFGVGLTIDGFAGKIFNLAPSLLKNLQPRIVDTFLELPVVKEIPIQLMGMGVGGAPPEEGAWCIQSSPPYIVEKYGLGDLKIGDLVACKDGLMYYGKGYRKGSITVGVITTGSSEIAGHGPQVVAMAASETGAIKPRLEESANLRKYLELEA
jgi:hypothetical protein